LKNERGIYGIGVAIRVAVAAVSLRIGVLIGTGVMVG